MPLDSTVAQPMATDGKLLSGHEFTLSPEEAERSGLSLGSWVYMFLRRGELDAVNKELLPRFQTFIHTDTIYKRKGKSIRHEVRQSVPGLLFVRGDWRKVQSHIERFFPWVRLARDCATGGVARVPAEEMELFIRASRVASGRLRVMPHVIEYYAGGHDMVKIASGPLAGFVGYCVRISRDRCLVTTMGGLTVSIGGMHGEELVPAVQ